MLLDPVILTESITKFGTALASISVPSNNWLRVKKLFNGALKSDLFEQVALSEDIIHKVPNLVHLLHETSIEKPVEDNTDEECDDIDNIVPVNNSINILHQQINSAETTTNAFFIHNSKYNNRSMIQKHHDSVESLEVMLLSL